MDLSSPYFPMSRFTDRSLMSSICSTPDAGYMMKQDTMDDSYDTSNYPGALYPGSYPIKPEPEEAYTHTIAEADSAGTQPDSSSTPKKRPKKKRNKLDNDDKFRTEPGDMHPSNKKMKQEKITETFKERKKVDRFNGMPEEEVAKRTLPDHLLPNLDIVIIGINPGLFAAYKGHHYAGPGNHFWKCLYLSGLIPEPMTSDDDYKLLEFGIGFTNMVARTTRGSADLPRKEIKEGAKILLEKLQKFQPKIAVFNGKGIYEVFSGKKNFDFGKQPDIIEGTNTIIFVMPSSSARCAQLPRAIDKVPFYEALKKLRDHLNGRLPNLSESEVTFPDVKLKIESDDGIKAEALDIKEDSEDGSPMMGFHSPDGGTNGVADGDKPKPSKKATKKKNAKKKKVDDEESNISNQPGSGPVNHQQVQAQAPHQPQPPQLQYPQQGYPMGPAADPYSNLRVKSEKNDGMLYGYGQQGCPYGGYPSPQSQGASYYSGTHNPGHYGNYPPPPPAHQGAYMSSGSLNQLENFVDQIPNIGHPSMEYSAPRPQYVQGPLGYPPPPPAHEQQSHNGSLYPQSHAPPGIGYGYNTATPVPPSSPSYSPSQPYGADSYSQQRSPVYTDLDSVQVKQERMDPGYGGY